MRLSLPVTVASLSLVGALSSAACSQGSSGEASGPSATTTSATTATATAGAGATGGRPADDEAKPLYPVDGKEPDLLAVRFCQAVHDLEAGRRGDCCGAPGDKGRFTGECARTLSSAMRSKAVTLEPAAVDACAGALEKELEGCGWVGSSPPPLPAVCDGLMRGQLGEGAVCRSSLECAEGRACQGLTATRTGKCLGPRPAGVGCGGSVDTLAALTRQNRTEVAHPECAGHCARFLCADTVAAGGACKSHEECGAGNACVNGKCSSGALPGAGAACAGDVCAAGLRCVSGKCAAPGAEGAACGSDLECRGACVDGKCGKRCPVLTIPTRPAFSVKSTQAPPKH